MSAREDCGPLYVQCRSCGDGVRMDEAFTDPKDGEHYHGECAGMVQCENCGSWNPRGKRCRCEMEEEQ